MDVQDWCFGKRQTSKHVGFSLKNIECKLLCPDKKVCQQFVNIKT
jgi:hypothetical protein